MDNSMLTGNTPTGGVGPNSTIPLPQWTPTPNFFSVPTYKVEIEKNSRGFTFKVGVSDARTPEEAIEMALDMVKKVNERLRSEISE